MTTVTPKDRIKVHIRWMVRRDMPEVLEIEALSFEYAWGEEEFLHALRQRNIIGMVAEKGEQVVGFFIYALEKHSLEILNVAVHPSCRHGDIGTQMVQKLIGKLASHRRTKIKTRVRETNLDAQLFFKCMGFEAIQVDRGYYEDEDAYLLQHRLS